MCAALGDGPSVYAWPRRGHVIAALIAAALPLSALPHHQALILRPPGGGNLMKGLRSTASLRRLGFGIVVGALVWATSPTPSAVNFTNSSTITIPASGNGSPYPSNIIV